MTMLTPDAEQLVRTYLDDLGRMLDPAPAVERADILDQVREHIDIALADHGEPQDASSATPVDANRVREVLTKLGSPGQIAAGSLAASLPAPGNSPPQSDPPPSEPPQSEPPPSEPPPSEPPLSRPRATDLLAAPWLPWAIVGLMVAAAFLPLDLLLIPAGITLFLGSPLWTRRAKVIGTATYLLPVAGLIFYLAAFEFTSAPAPAASGLDGASGAPGEGVEIFLPASYDATFSLLLVTPLWCAGVAVVLAILAHRNRSRDA